MTGITTVSGHNRSGMIWICAGKTGGVMTGSALGVGVMGIVAVVRTHSDTTIVTTGTLSDDAFMVEATVRVQVEEMIGVVAVVAFCTGLDMEFGFSDRHNIIMAITTGTEYLVMIDNVDQIKTGRGMTGFT